MTTRKRKMGAREKKTYREAYRRGYTNGYSESIDYLRTQVYDRYAFAAEVYATEAYLDALTDVLDILEGPDMTGVSSNDNSG